MVRQGVARFGESVRALRVRDNRWIVRQWWMAIFEVHVVPHAKRAGAYGWHGGLPRLRVSSPASDGLANAEAERLLSGLVRARVHLVGGARSRRKRFEVDLALDELNRRLRAAFG